MHEQLTACAPARWYLAMAGATESPSIRHDRDARRARYRNGRAETRAAWSQLPSGSGATSLHRYERPSGPGLLPALPRPGTAQLSTPARGLHQLRNTGIAHHEPVHNAPACPTTTP